jgi:putative PIN family toxin of toxin-antitoxin system
VILRAVYDTMIFFQWAVLPENRQHRTIRALYDQKLRLCLSGELLAEVHRVLTRPESVLKFPALTPQRVNLVLDQARKYADFFQKVPRRFSLPFHPKDNHLFDLAIEAKAEFLVTWESRLLKLQQSSNPHGIEPRNLAPNLRIIEPPAWAEILNA